MKYLKKFESFEIDDNELYKNQNIGNSIIDRLESKDIFPVRKPDSWEEVEENSIDFEDLDNETLKLIFKLPVYKANQLLDVFDRKKHVVLGTGQEVFDQELEDLYSGKTDVRNTNYIFFESLKIKYQYFIIHFDLPDFNCALLVDTQGFDYMRYVIMIRNFSDLYDYYKKEIELSEHYRYIDSLIRINESLVDTEKIKQVWTKILDRVKGLPASMKRRIIIYGIASLMALGSVSTITNIIKSYQTEDVIIKDAVDEAFSQFKDATKLRVSPEGKEHIKSHEGLKLVGYDLKDGKISIGYGHAEPIDKSMYKVGQKISKEEADKLFKKDLKKTADGVRRIFSEWKEKGIDRKITQDQFNALVSMAFNMGISGLRQTDLIQQIKSGNLEKAGELIKTTKINDDTFPGLRDRREKEAEMFMSYLNENQPDKG